MQGKAYFATADIDALAEAVTTHGGTVLGGVMPVADLGRQVVFNDPAGANLGAWQPASFHGFTVLEEPGTPSWVEYHAHDYRGALDFYRAVFGWNYLTVSDTPEFRYSVVEIEGQQVAGIMDAAGFLPPGVDGAWSLYWEVADADATCRKAAELGATVVTEAEDTPYGTLAQVADPAGAQFKLRAQKQ
jgi:predicted enzyme related to lactoylglutathione lyase